MAYAESNETWIVGAVRTPIGRHGGALSTVRPDDLGAVALSALMERTGVPPAEVEDVYMGCANQAGEDNRDVARMSLLLAGFPETVAGATVNRLCGSGLEAVAQAARSVMLGEADAYVGGGVESMSRAPYVLPKSGRPFPTGHATMYDTTLGWRMVNPKMEELGHTDTLGTTAENLAQERFNVTPDEDQPEGLAEEYDVSREAQDRFALRSHQKAVEATDEKRFREEITPVTVKARKEEKVVEADEGPRRDTTLEKLAKLKSAFKEGGSVTAGNSSSLNDGAAAVMVVSRGLAEANGLRPLAKIKSMVTVNTSPIAQAIVGGRLLAHDASLWAATTRERAVYAANVRHLLAGLDARLGDVPGVRWNTPAGGFFVVLTVPFPVDDALLEHSPRRYRVLWTPMHHFYDVRTSVDAMRLSASAVTAQQIDAGLDGLAALVRDQLVTRGVEPGGARRAPG